MNRLNEDAPRADGPAGDECNVQPYPHQLAGLFHMRLLEGSSVPGQELTTADGQALTTSIGFLCDPPGAGKTLTMLLHLLTSSEPAPTPFYTRTCMSGCVNLTTHAIGHMLELETDLVIVPRGTLRQWSDCLSRMLGRALTGGRRSLVKATLKPADCEAVLQGSYSLVITAESGARALSDSETYGMVRFRRIVIDEADSVRIPAFRLPYAKFRWMVTATPYSFPKVVELRAFMGDVRGSRELLDATVMIASTPEFVQSSLQLQPYVEHNVQVRRSTLNRYLRTLVPDGVMNALDANDTRAAVSMLGLDSVADEDNLIRAVMAKRKQELKDLRKMFATAPVSLLQGLEVRITEAERVVANIEERIRSADCCPIGLCDFTPQCVRAVVPCCHNTFLFLNIMSALQRQPLCPLCKASLNPRHLVVIDPGEKKAQAQAAPPPPPELPDVQTHSSSLMAFQAVLQHIYLENPRARVLVFSDYDMHEYERALADMAIRSGELKGHTAHIGSTIARFEKGELQALTVSVRHFGAGLNLHMADHIVVVHRLNSDRYTQLIGRSQRPGRTGQLNVWRLQYTDALAHGEA